MSMAVAKPRTFIKILDIHDFSNFCRYECIENDLLGSLQFGIHNIAPYHSKGIEKATELSVSCNPNVTNTHEHQSSDYHAKGTFFKSFAFFNKYVCLLNLFSAPWIILEFWEVYPIYYMPRRFLFVVHCNYLGHCYVVSNADKYFIH